MKRGLIFERNSMVNSYYSQGLPRIYGQLAPNLKMLYDFSERTGGKVYDLCGNQDGVIIPGASGNTTAQQMFDNGSPGGLDFDGVNDYVNMGTIFDTYIDYNKKYSFEVWFVIDAIGSTTNYQFCGKTIAEGGGFSGFALNIQQNQLQNYLQLRYSGTSYLIGITATSTAQTLFTIGKLYHLVATYNGNNAATGFTFIINGAAIADDNDYNSSFVVSHSNAGTTGYDVFLGSRNYITTPTPDQCMNARYYKYAFYDKDISVDEALTLYNYEKQFMR